ncbi:MAG: dipeptidase [Chitinophagaceae bacterium]
MKFYILFLPVAFSCANPNISKLSYQQLHEEAIVVDTHNDILTTAFEKNVRIDSTLKGITHTDIVRLEKGGVDVQIFSVWSDGSQKNPYLYANRQIDTLYAWINRNPDKMVLVKTPEELQQTVSENKLAAMIGLEGGHMIEDNLENLNKLYERGVRYMTLTWNNSTSWATSAMDEAHLNPPEGRAFGDSAVRKGLTYFGKQVVNRMNELGVMVDVSHVGEQTFRDVMATVTKPVIASHSSVYTFAPVFRNLKDEQIRAIGKNGGVIHVNFYSGFLDSNFFRLQTAFLEKHKQERDSLLNSGRADWITNVLLFEKYADEVQEMRPTLEHMVNHIDYIVKLAGVNHVGLGADYDGADSFPKQLDDVTTYPLITKELLKRGYSQSDIKKILGENFLRVFKANQQNSKL